MFRLRNLDAFSRLKSIIAQLRSPRGCPWDKKQTHTSLKPFLLEECYEVLEAIEKGNSDKLCEELGDLLMQIVLHAQIAAEAKEFTIEDVIQKINDKLIRRHPHVFGKVKLKDAEEVAIKWEALKREERGLKGSLLEDVPVGMPALAYSQSIQQRAAEIGFDWERIEDIVEKLAEEVRELKEAQNHRELMSELGDLLFTLANIARRLNVDLEVTLREANQRFLQRFSYMERICREQGVDLGTLSFEEQNALWDEAKGKIK